MLFSLEVGASSDTMVHCCLCIHSRLFRRLCEKVEMGPDLKPLAESSDPQRIRRGWKSGVVISKLLRQVETHYSFIINPANGNYSF